LSAFSFEKTDRIVKRAEFKKLWKSGKRIYGDCFFIHYVKNDQENSRLGVTVSKRVGCAVVRNRIKRLIREFFRLHRAVFNDTVDMNVIAKAGAGELSNQKLRRALGKSFLKIS